MIPISAAFRTELNERIRKRGYCDIWFAFENDTPYHVPEYYIKRVEFHNVGDPLARRLPTEECTIVLLDPERLWDAGNPDGLYGRTNGVTKLRIKIGISTGNTIEWTETVEYRSDAQPVWSNGTAMFHYTRTLAHMTSQYRGLSNWTTDLGKVATDVADQCRKNSYDWLNNIHAQQSLYNTSVNAHTDIGIISSKDALLLTAQAGKATLKTSYIGKVLLHDYWKDRPSLNPAIVYADDMYEIPAVNRLPLVKYVVVGYQVNPRGTIAREEVLNIRSTESPSASDPYFVKFSKPIARETFETTLTNIAEVTFMETRNGIEIESVRRTDYSQPWQIVGTGVPLSPVHQTYYNLINQAGSADEEIDNPLINGSTYKAVPNYRGEYLTKTRDLYSITYRGDPSIEHLDIIRVELPYYGLSECIVLENTFVYENGFSGTLKVRRIDDPFPSQIIPDDMVDALPNHDALDPDEVL